MRPSTIFLLTALLFLLFQTENLYSYEIGKVIQVEGFIERSSITTGYRFPVKIGTPIHYAQKIKVGPESFLEILLNNGTSVFIRENSLVYFFNIRIKRNDPPTKIKLSYGKIKIIPKRIYNDRSLVLTTQTAAVSVVDAKFSAVSSEYETRVIAYSSKVGVANINPYIKTAFIVIEGEEVSIKKNTPPSPPAAVPSYMIEFWLQSYHVSSDHRFIIKTKKEEGIIDWLLRKREF